MKTKIIILLVAIAVIGAGVSAWFVLRPSPPLSNSEEQTSEQQPDPLPRIELNITAESLARAQQSQSFEVSIKTDDYTAIARVEYLLDGKVVARSIEAPFEVTINLAEFTTGEHRLQAIAYNIAGNTSKSQVFTFVIKKDEVAPSNQESQGTVRRSTSQNTGSSGSSSPGNGGDNNGGGEDPDPGANEPVRTAGGWYASLPTQLQACSNDGWNAGPASPPAGAIVVPAGDNKNFDFEQDDKTFWFAPGIHTLGTHPENDKFGGVITGNSSTYIGAPGAIIDGSNAVFYAFKGHATNVRVAYLEIRNFGRGADNNNEGVINHDSGTGWTMEYLYAHHNDGAAVFIGSKNTLRYSCLKDNGQYGFSMFKPQLEGDSAIKDIVLDHNEISGNNQDDWENEINGCGCTGGGKFWDVEGAIVTNNYVHDNLSTGLWADTNNIDFLFDSNWIEHNEGEGIWYEISYNATISRNVIKRNAWSTGANNTGSPAPAIYISESGGDNRLQSSTSGSTDLQIKNNLIEDNFSGVSIFENANRFCNSNGNTSKSYCTPFVTPTIIPEPHNFIYPNPINNTHPCYTQITNAPYIENCRWRSKNVKVFHNEFRFTEANVPCAGDYCGVQALIATGADNIPWDPPEYNVANVQNRVMFSNNNRFYSNTYHGNWRFAKGYGEKIYFDVWQATPFNQDSGSGFNGLMGPPPVANSLDNDTSTLEGSIGEWATWFGATASRSNVEAHSGTHSLQISVTGGGNWATQLDNYPGFPAGPGNKHISFWAKQGIGATPTVTMIVEWYADGSSPPLQNHSIPLNLSTNWQQATIDNITAPAGTTSVFVELHSSTGGSGNTVYADDFVVGDDL